MYIDLHGLLKICIRLKSLYNGLTNLIPTHT